MATANTLGDHEGKPIKQTTIEVRNIAGGLNKAAATNPAIIKEGDKAFLVVEVVGKEHGFVPIEKGAAWERVNVTKAVTVAIVGEKLVEKVLDSQRLAELALEEEAKGAQRLSNGNGSAEFGGEVERDHAAGLHKRKRKNCLLCTPPAPEERADAE